MTKATMTNYGLLWRQDLLLTGAIILLVLGGIMVLIGYRSSFGSLLLLLYYIPVTFIIHSFWNDPEKVQRIQAIMFMKNLAIMGGLLMIIVNGSGKYSIKRLLATIKV
jgi:putative oxidoreductase